MIQVHWSLVPLYVFALAAMTFMWRSASARSNFWKQLFYGLSRSLITNEEQYEKWKKEVKQALYADGHTAEADAIELKEEKNWAAKDLN